VVETQICEYCGTENPIDRSHCKSCGAVLKSEMPLDVQENPKAVYEKLLAICVKYEANDWCNTIETLSTRKLRRAMKAFGIPAGEQVIMVYDDTVFGSNKLGFAICETGLYWKNAWDTPTKRTKLSWKQYVGRDVSLEEYKIELGQGDRISVANREEDREKIAEFLREIRAALVSDI
jgi:hypothetical protein